MWGKNEESTIVYPIPIENDPLIRVIIEQSNNYSFIHYKNIISIYYHRCAQFYKVCSKWYDEVDNNTASRVEWQKFINGPEVAATVSTVSNRLGFSIPLSYGK